MHERQSFKKQLPGRALTVFFLSALFVVGVLQGLALFFLNQGEFFICNGRGAWPFSSIPLLGTSFISIVFTAIVLFLAWKDLSSLGNSKECIKPIFWGVLLGVGVSHTLERIWSQCVLDYWYIPLFSERIAFNFGDILLTCGVIYFLISFWKDSDTHE